MQIINKIDHLITKLTELKPSLTDDSSSNEKRFNDLLTASIAASNAGMNNKTVGALSQNAESESDMPSWVDPNYAYDPKHPRKPNMRELIEAMSGKNLEDLYKEPDENWQKTSGLASQMLYGVLGANEDIRDWQSIMRSSDILAEAREQTGAMYEPKVDVQSNFNTDGILTDQIAVLKDNKNNTLRSLTGDITSAEETLLNFGATKKSIPTDLEKRINPEKFDNDLLALLKNFDNNPKSVQQIVVQVASEAIANKLSQEIPPDELAKL